MDLEKLIRGYALKNAVKYGGKARADSIVSMILKDMPELRGQAKALVELTKRVVEQVNSMSPEEQREALAKEYPELMETKVSEAEKRTLQPLPGAKEGSVVLRFAPNPDFYIHLGNARPAILCDEYAKAYRGKMILRFEDTDPRTKTPMKEAYDAIKEDLKWLGVTWHEEYIQSLRLEIYYDIAKQMITRGCAYVDVCKEEGKRLLASGRYCESRDREPEWHLEHLDRMISGHYSEGDAILRIKTDPQHPNPSIRDWAALRIIDTDRYPHPITGSKYVVWPLYNFSVSVDDYLMGVTHVIRGKEHEVNTEKQLYVYKCMGWSYPVFIHTGRLKLEGFILSKSKIRELLSKNPGSFLGYDDPRFGTIASLRRRGVLPETIRSIILEVGIKESNATISWVNLASVNRAILDPRADRIMFVHEPKELSYDGKCIKAEIPFHPDRPRKRSIELCSGDKIYLNASDASGELRLLGGANVKIEGDRAVYISDDLMYAKEKKLPIVQWVKASEAVELTVYVPEGLSLKKVRGLAEKTIEQYPVDSRLQLIRFGFVRIDRVTPREAIYTHG